MVEVVLAEVLTVATVGRQRLILELFKVDELRLIDIQRVIGLRV